MNGEVLGTVTSQFIRYSFDLPSLKGLNRLEAGCDGRQSKKAGMEMIFKAGSVYVDTGLCTIFVYMVCFFLISRSFCF